MNDSEFKCLGGMYEFSSDKDERANQLEEAKRIISLMISNLYFSSQGEDGGEDELLDRVNELLNGDGDE